MKDTLHFFIFLGDLCFLGAGRILHSGIDYLIRLERFSEDFEIIMEQVEDKNNTATSVWFESRINFKRVDKTYRRHIAVDDIHTRWIDLCNEEKIRSKLVGKGEDAVMTLLHHYAWHFYKK